MPKETAEPSCIVCDALLTEQNWSPAQKANWINKCADCLRVEKKVYARKWREKNRVRSAATQKRCTQKLRQEDPVKARARAAYGDSLKRATACGMEHNLTPEFVLDLMRNAVLCPYFGEPLTFGFGKSPMQASLDRIDSSKGYVIGNVQVISYMANLMKSSATVDQLIKFANGVQRIYGNA